MKLRFLPATALLVAVTLLAPAFGASLDTAAFSWRIPVTVSGYTGESTLTDFPVLVTLAADAPSGFDYAKCAADGSDLRFADADGNLLSHEIETWDANGTSFVWVKLPALAGTATSFSAYFGTNGVSALPEVLSTNVWSRYAAVFHGGATIADATGHATAITANGATTATSGGKAGGVMSKGSAKGVTFSNPVTSGALSTIDSFSFSGWFKTTGVRGSVLLVNKNRNEWNNNGFVAIVEGGTYFSVGVGVNGSGAHQGASGKGALVTGTWGHLSFSYDKSATTLKSYFNGDGIYSTTSARNILDPGKATWGFGGHQDSTDYCFQGDMDEVRVFNGTASADWIKAEYDSVNDPAAFAKAGTAVEINLDAPRFGSVSAAVNRSDATFSVALSNVSAETAVSVFYGLEGSTFAELPLGTLSADGTLTATAAGLGAGSYVWYARATSTVAGVTYTPSTARGAFAVTYAKDPTASYKHFTATVSYAGTPAADIPVLLRISEDSPDGFHYADVTETGFEFVDADGNILPWEIDTWDTTGTSLVWVKVPSYAGGATVTARYGGAFANARPAASGVWSGYVGVWHLNETNSASAYGSYPNSTAVPGIDGEKAQASVADEEGAIGKSVMISQATSKQGTGYQLGGVFVPDSGANAPLDLGDSFVISGWFKHKDFDYYWDKLFAKRKKASNQETPNGAFAIEIGNSGGSHIVTACGAASTATKQTFPKSLKNAWNRLTFVYEGTSCRIYQNGAFVGTSTIAAATDNDAYLCFGNTTSGYGAGTGDAAWAGWIDEVRLADGVPTADWLAAEQAAMTNLLSYGAVASVDLGDPRIAAPVVERLADGTFRVTAEISQNEPVAGSVKCVAGGVEFAMTTEDAALPATYSAVLSGLPAGTYTATVQAEAAGGSVVSRTGAAVFHAGALVVSNVADADEAALAPGTFRISRADADPTDLPALAFDVAFSGPGLDAVVAPGVTTLTIPAGEASVEISVTPVYTTAVDEDTTLTLAVSGAFIGTPSSGSITIVNSPYDPAVRYVATSGDDANHGCTLELPKKTIAAAISSLDAIVQTLPCTVHVAPGLYPISSKIVLTNAIHVVGDDPDPSHTFVSNTVEASYYTQDQRIFQLNHAEALVANLTMQKGQEYGDGGNLYIGSAGGTVSNCVIEAGYTRDNGKAGGAWLEAGVVTHTIFRRNNSNSSSVNWQGNRPGLLQLNGQARAENCLFTENNQYRAVTLINLGGSSVMRNCTIVDTSLSATNDYCKSWSALNIGSGATVQNVVIAGVTNTMDGAACPPTGSVAQFQNGAFDGDVSALPAGTVSGTAAAFFPHHAENVPYEVKYRPKSGGLLADKGANYEPMALYDLSGERKRKIGAHVDIGCFEANAAGTVIIVK